MGIMIIKKHLIVQHCVTIRFQQGKSASRAWKVLQKNNTYTKRYIEHHLFSVHRKPLIFQETLSKIRKNENGVYDEHVHVKVL